MNKLKSFLLKAAVTVLHMIYLPMCLCRIKNKITIISRQSNEPTIDNYLLAKKLHQIAPETEIVLMTRQFNKDTDSKARYLREIIKQTKALATSRVVIVDGYCIPVSVLPHRKDVKVVQTWHSLAALKKFGYQTIGLPSGSKEEVAEIMHMHEGYDYVLAPGRFTAESFCKAFNVSEKKIILMGLPRIDVIMNRQCHDDEIVSFCRIDRKKTTLLYAPTFRKGRKISAAPLMDRIDFDRYNLIIKIHPLDSIDTDDLPNGVIVDFHFNTYDLMKFADIIISDYSAVGVEAMLLNKPVYFYVYDIEEYEKDPGLNVDYEREFKGIEFKKANELAEAIESEDDYPYEKLKSLRNKFFDCDTENCTEKLADFIVSLL